MIKLNVSFDKPTKPFGELELSRAINALEKIIKPGTYTINVGIVDESKVRALNKRYSGVDRATDVLSFNYTEDGQLNAAKTADVVISTQHLKSQAKAAGTNNATELALLSVHGILHVLGFDHQNQRQVQELDDIQRSIMEAAGLEYRNFGWVS